MMACCKLLANREFKLAASGQQRRRHPTPRQPERQNALFGRATSGHTGNLVAAPIGGSARVLRELLADGLGLP
jgi:hypothetical protein